MDKKIETLHKLCEALMEELLNIKNSTNPNEILLVVDAMTGQDAVNVAESFNNPLEVTGVILSKLDSSWQRYTEISESSSVEREQLLIISRE